jgi:hypothetical protein
MQHVLVVVCWTQWFAVGNGFQQLPVLSAMVRVHFGSVRQSDRLSILTEPLCRTWSRKTRAEPCWCSVWWSLSQTDCPLLRVCLRLVFVVSGLLTWRRRMVCHCPHTGVTSSTDLSSQRRPVCLTPGEQQQQQEYQQLQRRHAQQHGQY